MSTLQSISLASGPSTPFDSLSLAPSVRLSLSNREYTTIHSYTKHIQDQFRIANEGLNPLRDFFQGAVVTKLELFKNTKKVSQHEFVVATVVFSPSDGQPPSTIYLKLERGQEEKAEGEGVIPLSFFKGSQNDALEEELEKDLRQLGEAGIAGSRTVMKTLESSAVLFTSLPGASSSSASLNCKAADTFKFSPVQFDVSYAYLCDAYDLTVGVCEICRKEGLISCEHTLSLLSLLSIATVISSKQPLYQLLRYQCFWYAAILLLTGRHCSKNTSAIDNRSKAGRFLFFNILNDNELKAFASFIHKSFKIEDQLRTDEILALKAEKQENVMNVKKREIAEAREAEAQEGRVREAEARAQAEASAAAAWEGQAREAEARAQAEAETARLRAKLAQLGIADNN